MSITTSLQKLETDITNAYSAINTKGGTIPSDKNTNNLSTAISSIPAGSIDTITYSQVNELSKRFYDEVTYTGNATGTITLTTNIISSNSSSTNIASVSHNEKVATITGIASGKSTITLTTSNGTTSIIANVTSLNNVIYLSLIESYADTTVSYTKSKPLGKNITTQGGTLSLTDDYTGITFVKEINSGTYNIKNITPTSGNYIVKNNNSEVIESIGLIPTGALKMIDSNASNIRDLGGWSCDGGTIKYGKLIRGGEVTYSDREILVEQCGIKCELNLRGKQEAGRDYSILGDDIDYCCPTNYVWHQITDKVTWKEILRCVFDSIKNNKPVYFHCAAGADRTGTVASILEAILGVSESDLAKDYELTCMYTGATTDANARRRNEQDWVNEMNQIKNLSIGSTFRDKIINWVASMGFTVDEINEFRQNMIDGTPDTIQLDLDTFTITKNGSNVTYSNNINSITEYQDYEVNLQANSGYVISNVNVTIDGVAKNVFEGKETQLYRRITNNLTNCTTNNFKYNTIDGQGYGAIITPDNGYKLEGGTILITEGGIDMTSTYYSEGKITIPEVTGDISITVTAIPQGPSYTNVWELYKVNSRLNTAESDPVANGMFISAFIPLSQNVLSGDTIVLRSNKDIFNYAARTSSGDYLRMYPSETPATSVASDVMGSTINFVREYDSETGIYTLTIKSRLYSQVKSQVTCFRFCAVVSSSSTAITEDWFDGCILTINEEIV